MFRGGNARVDMTVEVERRPTTSHIRKKQRIRTGDDDTPLGGLDLGRPTD
jgi:hypothetical protein